MFKNHPVMAVLASAAESDLFEKDDEELAPIAEEPASPQFTTSTRLLFNFDLNKTDELCDALLSHFEPIFDDFNTMLAEQQEIHSFVTRIEMDKCPSSPTPSFASSTTACASPSSSPASPSPAPVYSWAEILERKRRGAFTAMRATKKRAKENRPSRARLAKDPDYSWVREDRKKAVLSVLGRGSNLRFSEVHPEYVAREVEEVTPSPATSTSTTVTTTSPTSTTTSTPSTPSSITKNPFIVNWSDVPNHQRRLASSVIKHTQTVGRALDAETKAATAMDPDCTFARRRTYVAPGTSRLRFGEVHADYRPREDWWGVEEEESAVIASPIAAAALVNVEVLPAYVKVAISLEDAPDDWEDEIDAEDVC